MSATAALRLNPEGVALIRGIAQIKSDREFADRIGVDPSTFYRVINGYSAPGVKFIVGAVTAFGPDCFKYLFEVSEAGELEQSA